MTHAALVAVDATPTALVHAFHPILTAALGTVLLARALRARGNGSAWRWALSASARRAAVARHRQPGAAGLEPVRPHRRHALLKRFCADVPPFESTAVQLIGGALMTILLMLAVRDAALALDRAFRRGAGLEHARPCRSSAWRSTT